MNYNYQVAIKNKEVINGYFLRNLFRKQVKNSLRFVAELYLSDNIKIVKGGHINSKDFRIISPIDYVEILKINKKVETISKNIAKKKWNENQNKKKEEIKRLYSDGFSIDEILKKVKTLRSIVLEAINEYDATQRKKAVVVPKSNFSDEYKKEVSEMLLSEEINYFDILKELVTCGVSESTIKTLMKHKKIF